MQKNKQSSRSFTAFIVTWAFLILTVTGLILYVVPQGRVAYWTHWALVGLDKEQWGDLHMMFGGVFIAAGVIHLWFNWKPFRKYIADRGKSRFEVKREVWTSLALVAVIGVMSVLSLPPVSWVFELNDRIKDAWVTSPDLEPPFGHAEEASLAGLAKRMDLDLDQAVVELRARGLRFEGPRDSLDEIARANGLTPMAVYALIRRFEHRPEPAALSRMTPEEIEAKFAGTGVGRKTLAALSAGVGVDAETALARLRAAGYQATVDESARDIAERHELNPIDVLKLILLPDYRP